MQPDLRQVATILQELQDSICDALETEDGEAQFVEDRVESENGGISAPRVMSGGTHIERSGVNFTFSLGDELPKAATARRPELAGCGFQAASLSLIVHPRNPYVPTTHANFRCFVAMREGKPAVWWMGGGYDLTPYYGFDEDAVHWHRTARQVCDGFSKELYPSMKDQCDDYFYLEHRKEPRGIGGVFFDDFRLKDWSTSVDFLQQLGQSFLAAYMPIVQRRKNISFGQRERDFQLYRRGRYVEFNLLYDRGTKYGIQSGRRIESVMCSMPPLVAWSYEPDLPAGEAERTLYERFLVPRDWAGMEI
ncbi:MAG: oxygen-dependent coproporphyrinogen oxidase [Deltaproteobacteria bacterium]|nr:oxygen-dependent coproporphyrinogen oxidase [Deltaproteobacteria bacterium]